MKNLNTLAGFLAVSAILFFIPAKSSAQLFFDDFEQEISQNGDIFDMWTTENISGWHYWHIIPWGGINGSQCVRFENNDIYNNDWFITKQISAGNPGHIKLSFNHWHRASGNAPKLYYTNEYNGDASQSSWTEINYSLGANMEEWYSTGDIIIENPGDNLYFGFHYDSAPEDAVYLLLDNFELSEYTPPPPMTLVGNSEHFEYYTNISGADLYYQDIDDIMEEKYSNYMSIWHRPGFDPVFPGEGTIKIYYGDRNSIPGFNQETPVWDCGDIDMGNAIVYLAPLETTIQQEYYGNFEALAVNELSQMALQAWLGISVDDYYREGFGLYEMGYRPDRTNLLAKLNLLGTNEPEENNVRDISHLNLAGNKDLLASLFESKALLHCYFYNFYYNEMHNWWQLLKHYYIKDTDRIQLLYSTEHFDYYGATKENPYVPAMAANMEEQFNMQENRFNVEINHRINVCIYDVEVGKEINNRDDFQGLACGADKINTMHLDIGDYGLMNHEFMHMLVCICSNHNPGPGQFLNEGLAESTDAFMTDEEMLWHRYKIKDLFFHYQRKYNREPEWLEIVDNVEVGVEDPFWVDAYALGEMYWRYMNDKYPDGFWEKVKFFLAGGRDWTVFGGKTTEEEGAEFIQFMKELAFVGPPLESVSLPFTEDFENDFKGWTTMRFGANDHWGWRDDAGIDASGGAKISDPYWLEEKDVDSWLITPPLEVTTDDSLLVSFSMLQWDEGIDLEAYYTDNFPGPTGNTTWTQIKDINWDGIEGNWHEVSFKIGNPPDKVFVAFRFISNEENYVTYQVDNLSVYVKGGPTDINISEKDNAGLKIYPNPVNEKSVVTFDLAKAGNITLEIYNMHGQKLKTIFENKVPEGHYSIPVNIGLNKGIYLCKLRSSDGVYIEKFICK